MTEEEKNLAVKQEALPATDEAPGKKPGLVRGARDFIENTFASLKGKDMNQAVEEFTSEMTLVAEGLSEDQAALRREVEKGAAQLTLIEEKLLSRDKQRREEIAAAREELKQARKQSEQRAEAVEKRCAELEKRLDSLEKALKEVEKKPKKMGLGQILRQATWMVGIICAAWIIVTVLHMVGR